MGRTTFDQHVSMCIDALACSCETYVYSPMYVWSYILFVGFDTSVAPCRDKKGFNYIGFWPFDFWSMSVWSYYVPLTRKNMNVIFNLRNISRMSVHYCPPVITWSSLLLLLLFWHQILQGKFLLSSCSDCNALSLILQHYGVLLIPKGGIYVHVHSWIH